jgi:hypothetical protein
MRAEISELTELYEQGLVTKGEYLSKLIELSLDFEPEEYFDFIPGEIKLEIKRIVEHPPASVDEVFIIKYPTFARGVNVEEAVRKINKEVFESTWKLHHYLHKP